MKNLSLIFFITVTMISCLSGSQKFQKDHEILAIDSKYQYSYRNGKLVFSKVVESYYSPDNKLINKTETDTVYEYSKDGLLTRKIIKDPDKDGYISERFLYNEKGSLSKKFIISPEGDTLHWKEYKNFIDGPRLIFQRDLVEYFDPQNGSSGHIISLDETTNNPSDQKYKKTYDTTLYHIRHEYRNGKCMRSVYYDHELNPKKEIQYSYNHDTLFKEVYYSYRDSDKQLKKTKYYSYNLLSTEPGFYTIDTNNDTLELCRKEMDDNGTLIVTKKDNNKSLYQKSFYKNGRKVKEIDFNEKYKMINIYSYFPNGNLREIKTYMELNAH